MRKILGLDESATEEEFKAALAEKGVEGELFTQDAVNGILKKEKLDKRSAEKQLADFKKGLLDDVRRVVTEAKETDEEDDPDDGAGDPPKATEGDGKTTAEPTQADKAARHELKAARHELKKMAKKIEELEASARAERDRAAEIEKQAKIKDRDSKLRSACAKVRMADPDNDWRLFLDNMREDEEAGDWVFVDADGDPTTSIEDGLREALATRKHLLASTTTGGSGATGGSDKTGTAAKQQLAATIASANPRQAGDVLAVIKAKREADAAKG